MFHSMIMMTTGAPAPVLSSHKVAFCCRNSAECGANIYRNGPFPFPKRCKCCNCDVKTTTNSYFTWMGTLEIKNKVCFAGPYGKLYITDGDVREKTATRRGQKNTEKRHLMSSLKLPSHIQTRTAVFLCGLQEHAFFSLKEVPRGQFLHSEVYKSLGNP